ncbi:protein of unknown function DUF45 [hydrothermal vent metagenome]|uniref:YgjP-like metallopeptidase domain-containing protein n=1 Tax=hydrothermal vent metagenome TaxID=652676 RepID=A0A3B1B6W5_9ZZZZ
MVHNFYMPLASALSRSLPDYVLRTSPRCKRVLIKITPLGRVEVVVPRGFDASRVPAILLQRQSWLNAHLAKLKARWAEVPHEHALRPTQIRLQALDRCWQVDYLPGTGRQLRLQMGGERLQLRYPPIAEAEADELISRRLQKWLNEQARQHLLPWLAQTAEELGLAYTKACIRAQKTRWGSCSTGKVINLNRNLLFLPPPLVRYLFVHELSHIRHMNHSSRFWQQVSKYEPDYRRLDAELGQAGRHLPRWVHV